MSLLLTALNKEHDTGLSKSHFYIRCATQPCRWHFGKVINRRMYCSEEGELVLGIWREIPQHFPVFALDAFACRPDAVCGILSLHPAVQGTELHLVNDVVRWFKNHSGFELRTYNPHFSWSPIHTSLTIASAEHLAETRRELQRYR